MLKKISFVLNFLVLTFLYQATTASMMFQTEEHQAILAEYNSAIQRNFPNPDVQNFLSSFAVPQETLIPLIEEQHGYGSSARGRREFLDNHNENKKTDFYLKDQCVLSRVLLAYRLGNLIKNENYTTVAVPKKYLFLNKHENHLISASERVIPTADKEMMFDLNQMREFCDIATKIYFKDYNKGNFLLDQNKKIVFTDTELASFEHAGELKNYSLNQLKRFLLPENGECYMHDVKINIPEESKNYLCDLISKSDNKTEIVEQSFPQKKEHDTKDLKVATVWPIINEWCQEKKNSDSVREARLYPFKYMQ